MTALAERLDQLVSRREPAMRADLARYVAIPTGHNHALGLDEFRGLVTERCIALGAQVRMVPGEPRPDWLYSEPGSAGGTGGGADRGIPAAAVCTRTREGLPRLLVASHLDTVFDPRGPFQAMLVSSDGSRAVGPGVVDMKGGIVIALHALEALEEAGVPVGWTYFFNSDEETGSYHSAAALADESKRNDWGLATEPALPDGSLAIERKGSGQFIVEAFGRSAHAGRDFEKGVSAVYELARALSRVEALTDLSCGVTVNIGPIRGGAATNIVPDYAAAWGNVRFPSSAECERFRMGLEAINTPAAENREGIARIRVRHSLNRPAKPKTARSELLGLIARETAEAIGQTLPFASTGGVCDGNIMQDAGLPTIDSLGVRGGGLHTHAEWIDLSSLVDRCRLLAHLMVRLSARS